MYNPESDAQNSLGFSIQTDHLMPVRRPDIVIFNKKTKQNKTKQKTNKQNKTKQNKRKQKKKPKQNKRKKETNKKWELAE